MHYHIQKPWKMKSEPRIKLNCNTYLHHEYVHIFLAGVEGTEEVSSSLLLNDQVVGYIALCRIILLLSNLWASSPLMWESRESGTWCVGLYRSHARFLAARFTAHKWRAVPQALSPGHEILVTRQRYKKPPAMARCEVAHSLSIISHYTLR